ncbi:MAG: hypothetical protein GY847_28620, partial [Proteobacteria bacterium]|nr:hypothetical protein [Pseudomonadota bacterium]
MKINPFIIFAVIITLFVALFVLSAYKKINPFMFIFIALFVVFVAFAAYSIVGPFRTPPEYGPDEIVRGPDNLTVTMIARGGLITDRFFENQVLVAKAKETSGIGGIAFSLVGDPTEYLVKCDGDWTREVGAFLKRDIRLMLLAGETQIVTAKRVLVSLSKWTVSPHYVIDCPQGRFELVPLELGKFALRRDDTVLGIAAMPLEFGLSRIELPASLPLATRLFLAMLVD